MHILNKPLIHRNLVVQRLRGDIGFVREPMHFGAAPRFGHGIDGFDQGTANALSSRGGDGVQIIQIAARRDGPGGFMHDGHGHAEHFAIGVKGSERVQRAAWIVKSRLVVCGGFGADFAFVKV